MNAFIEHQVYEAVSEELLYTVIGVCVLYVGPVRDVEPRVYRETPLLSVRADTAAILLCARVISV